MALLSRSLTALLGASVLALGACGEGTAPSSSEKPSPSASSQAASTPSKTKETPVDQRSAEVRQLTEAALNSDLAYQITEDLTTEIGQRLAGTEAEARAREWMVERFNSLGFENVRVEPFTIKGWIRGKETVTIVGENPQDLYITSLGGSVATPESGIEADIVYFPTFEDLKDAPMTDLDGKIVFISGRMEKAHDGAGYGPANRKRRQGATEAGKRGASAVIIRSVGTDSHRFPHTGQMRYNPDVDPIPIAALSAPDADQLERLIERGQTVRIKMVLTPQSVGDLPSGNVIGEIIGSEKPDETIVIGGHLDSWDLGTGAVDDGAGIGITVGAAKLLMDSGLKPKRTIRVVAFGAEEVGLLGGYAYAKRHGDSLSTHVLASESDFGAGPVFDIRSGLDPMHEPFIKELEAQLSFLDIPFNPKKRSNGGPDIGPMHSLGVPALRLQQNGYDYFDLHHTPDDTMDKIDPDHMKQNQAAWVTLLWLASETERDLRETSVNNAGE